MHKFFLSILLYQTTFALLYNDPCTTNCNFPGMVCRDKVCKCDSKNRRFWTGARCSFCPDQWSMSETACITYYSSPMTWQRAEETCRTVNASLLNIPNKSIFPLIYNASKKNAGTDPASHQSGWTSAHGTSIAAGIYEWLDKSLPSFTDKSNLWCRKSTANLGYTYKHDEPTKLSNGSFDIESCLVFWRSRNTPSVACLDDQFCSRKYSFMCEISEYTENKFGAPPPSQTRTTTSKTQHLTSRPISGTNNLESTLNSGISTTIKPKQKSNMVIIIAAIVASIVLAFLVGLFLCFKSRLLTKKKNFTSEDRNKGGSIISDGNITEDLTEIIRLPEPPDDMNEKKQNQSKRGGYSKQQFDEFD